MTLRAGAVAIEVVHTPGHRPEHCSFVVDGKLVLTGDSLFVGDAARPDLAIEAREGATDLHHSLERLAALPDAMVVYPGHVAGSLCGTHMSAAHSSSIGLEKQTNHALHSNLRDFVEESASLSTPKPPTTERVVALNRGPWVGARPELTQLDAPADALVLDVRPIDIFAAGHLPGAISVALDGGSFATRSAFVLDPAERVALHAGSRADADAASRLLAAVGLFEQCGFLLGGGTETTPTLTVAELRAAGRRADTGRARTHRKPGEQLAEDPVSAPARRAAGRARRISARLFDLRKRRSRNARDEPARAPGLRRACRRRRRC